jgi:hypothetical protein
VPRKSIFLFIQGQQFRGFQLETVQLSSIADDPIVRAA